MKSSGVSSLDPSLVSSRRRENVRSFRLICPSEAKQTETDQIRSEARTNAGSARSVCFCQGWAEKVKVSHDSPQRIILLRHTLILIKHVSPLGAHGLHDGGQTETRVDQNRTSCTYTQPEAPVSLQPLLFTNEYCGSSSGKLLGFLVLTRISSSQKLTAGRFGCCSSLDVSFVLTVGRSNRTNRFHAGKHTQLAAASQDHEQEVNRPCQIKRPSTFSSTCHQI